MNRRAVLAAGGVGLAALAGCLGSFGGPSRSLPSTPTGTWRQYGRDARNTGAAPVTVPQRGTPAWDSGDALEAAPLVREGTVYGVASEATAIDGESGEEVWRESLPGRAEDAPALFEDRLVVAAGSELVALGAADGTRRWSEPLPGPAGGRTTTGALTLATDSPLVTVPVAEVGLVAYDPREGKRRWRTDLRGTRTAAVVGDTVLALGYRPASDDAVLRGLAASDGTLRWERAVALPTGAPPPVVSEAGVLVGAADGLAVHDPTDGRRLRTLAAVDGRVRVAPAVADGTAYVATGQALTAVSLDDGSREWRAEVSVATDTGVAVGGETVVAATTEVPDGSAPGVVALDRSNGTTRWTHPIEGFDVVVSTPPTVADGAVFYASNESTGVVALGDLPPAE